MNTVARSMLQATKYVQEMFKSIEQATDWHRLRPEETLKAHEME